MDALATVQRLAGGHLIEELADLLAKAAEAVVATGKSSTVSLTLKVSTKNQGDPFVVVEESLNWKSPTKDPKAAYFFAVDGELHRQDPRQPEMEFRTVDKQTGEIREYGVTHDVREAVS